MNVGPVVHFASVTTTLLSGTSPVFVTVNVKLAVPPTRTCCVAGDFTMWIAGWITSTSAVSSSVTSGPTGGVPVTVAVFVKSSVPTGLIEQL